MKRLLVLTLVLLALLNWVPLQKVYAQDEITVMLNDEKINFDAKPYIKDGRTLVPFRKVLEAFGAEVSWDAENQTVTAEKSSIKITLKIGANNAYVNGKSVNLDVAPEITGDRTFIPLRFVSENLGAEVKWDGAISTVFIDYNDHIYRLGQAGTYGNLRFIIDRVDTISEPGFLKIIGRFNVNDPGIVIEAVDDRGFVLTADTVFAGNSGGMYNAQSDMRLPGCHNFIAKKIIIKLSDSEKLVKIAEYEI